MARQILLVLIISVVACASLVLREERLLDPEKSESGGGGGVEVNSTEAPAVTPKNICDPRTPCAWSMYKYPQIKRISYNVTNSYCQCGNGTVCQRDEDNTNVKAFIHKCKPPDPDKEDDYYEEYVR